MLPLTPPHNETTVLLHSCCAPCSSAIIECMLANGIRPTVFYCNPNIYPREEYDIRKNEAIRFVTAQGLDFVDADYDYDAWRNQMLGLEHELYDKRSIEISGGQRQRIMLMIAALLQKDIVLLDEPTSALDPDSIARVIDYIRSLHEATVLMVSHDARFIDSFDRKIYIGD